MGKEIGWERVHRRLCRLARLKGRYDLEEMRWMRRAKQMGVHRRLGYGSFHEYIEHLFGYSPRFTYEKLRVADALDELPALREALREAKHSYSAVRELTRVATPDTEAQWLEAAEGKRVRGIERMVSGHDKGDRPGSDKKEQLRRHRLVYEVSGETKSVVQLARDKLTKQLGRSVTDDELLQHLARRELEDQGGDEEGRQSPNRIHYEVCPKCDDGAQVAGGEAEPVDDATVQRVKCDAKASGAHVGNGKRARQRPSPAQREAKMKEHRFGCAVPGCTNRVWLEDHHEDLVSEGGTDDPNRRVVLCWAHHDARHRGQLVIGPPSKRSSPRRFGRLRARRGPSATGARRRHRRCGSRWRPTWRCRRSSRPLSVPRLQFHPIDPLVVEVLRLDGDERHVLVRQVQDVSGDPARGRLQCLLFT